MKAQIFTKKRKIYTIIFVIISSFFIFLHQANKKTEKINSAINYPAFRNRMKKLENTLTFQVTFLSIFPFSEKYLLNSFLKDISAQTIEIVKTAKNISAVPMLGFPRAPRPFAKTFWEIYSDFPMFYYKGIEHFDDDFSFNNNIDKLRYWKEFVKGKNDNFDFLDNYYKNQKKMEDREKENQK